MKSPHRRGFTLLELLAVVAILGLLSVAVGVRLGGRGEAKLREAERVLLACDQWTRQLAMQRSTPVQLRFDLDHHLLQVESEVDGDRGTVSIRPLPAGVFIDRAVSTREERGHGEIVIRVYGDGSSDAYALRLLSASDTQRWVVLAGGTGQPRTFAADSKTVKGIGDHDVDKFFVSLRKRRFDAD